MRIKLRFEASWHGRIEFSIKCYSTPRNNTSLIRQIPYLFSSLIRTLQRCFTRVVVCSKPPFHRHNDWRHVASRPKRPLRSIVLDPGIKDLLMNDAREFLESRKWYTERGIPFRRGYLLVRSHPLHPSFVLVLIISLVWCSRLWQDFHHP